DQLPPRNASGGNTPPFVNLTPQVDIHRNTTMAGFIYLNADVNTTGAGGNPSNARQLIAPGEPFTDLNGNNKYDPDEWFIDIDYPNSLTGDYVKNGTHRVMDGFTRQDPAVDAASAGKWTKDINIYGVFYTNGTFNAQGNYVFFGTVVTRSGMSITGVAGAGNPDFYYDERLVKDQWPPFDLNLPR